MLPHDYDYVRFGYYCERYNPHAICHRPRSCLQARINGKVHHIGSGEGGHTDVKKISHPLAKNEVHKRFPRSLLASSTAVLNGYRVHRSLLSQPLPQELNGHIKFNDFEFIQEQYLDKVEGYDKRTVSARMTLEGIKKGVIIDDEHEDEKEDLKTRLHKAIAEKVGTEFTVQHISDLRVIPVDGQEAAKLSFTAEVPIATSANFTDAAAIDSNVNAREVDVRELLRDKINEAFEGAQGVNKLQFALRYATSRSQLVGLPDHRPMRSSDTTLQPTSPPTHPSTQVLARCHCVGLS